MQNQGYFEQGEPKFRYKTTAKTFRGWVKGYEEGWEDGWNQKEKAVEKVDK